MKKYIILSLATISILSIVLSIPNIVPSLTLKVSTTKKQTVEYSNFINTSGVVEQKYKDEISFNIPIVPSNVNVRIGQKVSQGDIIASVDKDLTQQAFLDMLKLSDENIPKDVQAVFSNSMNKNNFVKNNIPDKITSPATGTITSLQLSEGSISSPKEIVATISNVTNLQIKLTLNEKNVSQITTGQKVIISGDAFKGFEYTGYVTTIYPAARKKLTGTIQETVIDILVELQDVDEKIKPGFSAKGKIILDDPKNIEIIPYESIIQDDNGNEYVYIYKNKRASKVKIKTGLEIDNGVEVIEGISKNDNVIINPYDIKKDNSFVILN